ncbi:MAG: hypothetical protein QOE90_1712 [Thermoplasmata archaeon]|jgi:kumamolisin|nr:hypothetical protein [Thermoplasmata archaeon]
MRVAVTLIAVFMLLPAALPATNAAFADPGTVPLPGSLSPLTSQVVDLGVAPDATPVHVVVGLDLHNKAKLDAFLAEVSDPLSPSYQKFLTQDEFNARFGPTAEQEARVVHWLLGAGFTIDERFSNRLLVSASGDNAAAQRAFGVKEHDVLYAGAPHRATLDAPRAPEDIAAFITGVFGLDDLAQMQAMHTQPVPLAGATPKAAVGASCCAFGPNDLKVLYGNSATFTGTGQTIVIAGAYTWKDTDVTSYDSQWGLPALPAGSAQVCAGSGTGCAFDASNSIEVTLDVQMIHAVAPNAVVKNYMAQTTALTDFTTMYNKVVTDNPGHSVSTSWGICETSEATASQTQNDNIFANGNAVGQSWFAASGDSGSNDCGSIPATNVVDHPANAPHMMGVGGTHANCSPAMTSGAPNCQAYGSETSWSSGGGGVSNVFAKPSYQTGCGVPADGKRDVPDVSMEADTAPGNYVFYNGAWNTVGGTSDAAPMWGGVFALLNQKLGGSGQGLPGARIYQLCGGNSFHDVTSGNNGGYSAGVGYDMNTGAGTAQIDNLLTNWQAQSCQGTAPAAPTGLTATGGTGQVALSWTDGSNGGCAISAHKVYRGTASGGETLLTTSGAGTTYTDTSVTAGTTYFYKVTAVNSIGESAQSNEASATPTAPTCPGPANNCFASPTALSGTPASATQSTSGATTETGEPAPCGSIGATVWFTWTAPGSGTATVSTVSGSTTYDTVLAVYTGTSLTGLTNLACNDDFSGTQSQLTFTCTAGTTYRIQVGGYQGATGTAALSVSGCAASAQETTVYSANFDTGSATGWTSTVVSGTNLWHVDSACIAAYSPSYDLAYTQTGTCTYNTGARTAAHADTSVSLAGKTISAHLSFKHWFQVEQAAAGYDQMKAQYSCNGSTFTTLQTWDGGSTNPASGSWLSQTYDVSACKGGTLYIRFNFDSVDGINNAFKGWFIDNVAVTAA